MTEPILPDDLWRRVEPLLPGPRRKNRHVQHAGRKRTANQRILTGILFALKTGIPWRHLPATEAFPSGYTCRRYLVRWHRYGVWKKVLRCLLDELHRRGKLDLRRALVDSASVRSPSGGRKTGPNPVDRRKLGVKHHLLTDAQGTPLAIVVTAANRHDVTQLIPLVENVPPIRGRRGRPIRRPKRIQGDRGYDSEPHRRALKKKGSSRS
jgi:transposase